MRFFLKNRYPEDSEKYLRKEMGLARNFSKFPEHSRQLYFRTISNDP